MRIFKKIAETLASTGNKIKDFSFKAAKEFSSKVTNIGTKVKNLYSKAMHSVVTRSVAYGMYQLSIPAVTAFAFNGLYQFADNDNENAKKAQYSIIPVFIILFGMGTITSIKIGSYLQKRESGTEEPPSRIVKVGLTIFAMELGFMSGLQLYAFAVWPFIGSLSLNRSLITLAGFSGAAFNSFLISDDGKWAVFILPKVALIEDLSFKNIVPPLQFKKELLKSISLMLPSLRAMNMINFTIICFTSPPGTVSRQYDLGIYTSLIGGSLGTINLTAFILSKRYLGDYHRNFMSYLAHSAYISLGFASCVYAGMILTNDLSNAQKLDLGGWIYAIITSSLLIAGAIPTDQYRMHLVARRQIIKAWTLRNEGQELQERGNPSVIEPSTMENRELSTNVLPQTLDIQVEAPAVAITTNLVSLGDNHSTLFGVDRSENSKIICQTTSEISRPT